MESLLLLVFLALVGLFHWINKQRSAQLENAYQEYVSDLVGTMTPSRELFKFIFKTTDPRRVTWVLGMPVRFFGKETNHRDGDELVTNADRDAITRIVDHLSLPHVKAGAKVTSLGYVFKNPNNLVTFSSKMLTAVEKMPPNSAIIFPINNELCIFGLTEKKEKLVAIPHKVFKALN